MKSNDQLKRLLGQFCADLNEAAQSVQQRYLERHPELEEQFNHEFHRCLDEADCSATSVDSNLADTHAPPSDSALPTQCLESICKAFSSQLNKGEQPSIEFFLNGFPDSEREILLEKLIQLELLHQIGGPSADELQRKYESRFPDYVLTIRNIFSTAELPKQDEGPRTIKRPTCPICGSALEVPADGSPTMAAEKQNELAKGGDSSGLNPNDFYSRKLICPKCNAAEHSTDAELETESPSYQQLDRFTLLEQIGEGAFGIVWKARDNRLDRIVAIKIPRQRTASDDEIKRFVREARTAAQLRHPNIVAVYEVGLNAGIPYIVCEYIRGVDLDHWLKRRPTSIPEAVELMQTMAAAVQHAHDQGVVHRDLKPSNIMISTDNTPYVMDFGLAKRDAAEQTVTLDGTILGTPAYMSPEQARGQGHQADFRADLYSLGVILFYMLTGELPFRGDRQMVIYQILVDDPPSLRKLNAVIPADLETICLRCLEKEPQRRYQSCNELGEELARFRDGRPIVARPVGMLGKIWRWYSRNPRASMLAAGGFVSCTMIIMILWGFAGIVFYAFGIQPTEHPQKAMLEIAMLILVLYLPGLWAGVRILNGHFAAIWFSTLVLVGSSIYLILLMLNLLPPSENFKAAENSIFIRYQLSTLLGTILALGLTLHAIALTNLKSLANRSL